MSNIRVQDLRVTYMPVESLKARPDHPRLHSKKQIKQLSRSIDHFGWVVPIIIDEHNVIIDGHARVEAAKHLEHPEVPAINISKLTEIERRALSLALNRIPESTEWDATLLAQDFTLLNEAHFDISLTGFEIPEIEAFFNDAAESNNSKLDEVPQIVADKAPVSRLGDIWLLGANRLACANARGAASYTALMAGAKAQMGFTDCPFNVVIRGNVSGKGKNQHEEFVEASGELSKPEFATFLRDYMQNMVDFSDNGSIHYHFIDWRHVADLIVVAESIYSEFKNLCVWNKTNGGMGTFYRSKQELVGVFKSGRGPHINNFALGQYGRNRTNVWDYPGGNVPTREGRAGLEMHPTVKPVALVADAIKDCSTRGGIVLDPFMGSGTTIIAAELTGRRAYGMDLNPLYVDVAVRRWQQHTGEQAVDSEGVTFNEREKRRAVEDGENV